MDRQLTTEEAIAFGGAKSWEPMSLAERARFQIVQDKLCMPFSVFHEAVEKTLGRPVWTHEFGLNRDGIKAELLNGGPAPTFDEIMNMIPAEKRIVLAV